MMVCFEPNIGKWVVKEGLRILGAFRTQKQAIRVARQLTNS
jgi:hypothetical protein